MSWFDHDTVHGLRESAPAQAFMDELRPTFSNIPFGPKGCPDARLAMLTQWHRGALFSSVLEIRREMGGTPPEWIRAEQKTRPGVMASARLFWADPDMTELMDAASRQMTTDVVLHREMVPSLSGICFYARQLHGIGDEADDGPLFISAHEWYASIDGWGGGAKAVLGISSYGWAGRWHWWGDSFWPLGETIGAGEDRSIMEDRAWMATLFSLISSRGVVANSEEPLDRAARRRQERAGADPSATRVLYLRGSSSSGDGSGSGRYHHRWVVDGHWRSQPFGPGGKLRKPVWIGPYVKGPEGAPMLTGEKVRALVR